MPKNPYISAYLYTAGFNIDAILVQYIAPLVADLYQKKLISNYFFIRYSDDTGPHIRLRLLPVKQHADAVIRYIDGGYPDHLASQQGQLPPGVPSHIYSPYIPETTRYGGPAALHLCEQYFRYSSDAALTLISPFHTGGYNQRFALSLMLNLVFIYYLQEHLQREIVLPLLNDVVQSWMHSCILPVNDTVASADKPVDATAILQQFQSLFEAQEEELAHLLNTIWQNCRQDTLGDIAHLKKWGRRQGAFMYTFLKKVGIPTTSVADLKIFGSLIHMTNNRLGIRNYDESYLAYILLNFIRRTKGILA